MIKQYSLEKNGVDKLSDHFAVREFACRDGSDIILIDDQLPSWLEKIRMFFYQPIYISSGFRTLAYNTAINGAKNSNHISGRAADFDVGRGKTLVDPRIVCMYAETLNPRPAGLGCYTYPSGQSWIHIDNGNPGQYWRSFAAGKPYSYTASFLPLLKIQLVPRYSFDCEVMQQILTWLDLYQGTVDGKFGRKTDKAVINFQVSAKLAVDGICGPATWRALFNSVKGWWK